MHAAKRPAKLLNLETVRKSLLLCGVLATAFYFAINIYVPTQYPGYDWQSQVVSELSAIDAPTRDLWIWLCSGYTLLMLAFGYGVWHYAGNSRALRWAGAVILIEAVVGVFWPPMHRREVLAAGGGNLSDTLHIAFTAIWGIASIAVMALAGIAVRSGAFRLATAVMAVLTVYFGMLTGASSPSMEKNLPTPMIGVYERIGMAAYMLWVVVFALALMIRQSEARNEDFTAAKRG